MPLSARPELAAHLDAGLSLAVFRSMLDTLARPGTVGRLDELPVGLPPAVALAAAICDLDQHIAVLGASADDAVEGAGVVDEIVEWGSVLGAATGAQTAASLRQADVVVAIRPPTPDEVGQLRTGTARAPEEGARLLLACATIRPEIGEEYDRAAACDGADAVITVQGPGARLPRRVGLDGVGPEVFTALHQANRNYPAGIDTWCVGADRSIVALSRSSSIDVVGASAPGSSAADVATSDVHTPDESSN